MWIGTRDEGSPSPRFVKAQNRHICTIEQGQAKGKACPSPYWTFLTDLLLSVPFTSIKHAKRDVYWLDLATVSSVAPREEALAVAIYSAL